MNEEQLKQRWEDRQKKIHTRTRELSQALYAEIAEAANDLMLNEDVSEGEAILMVAHVVTDITSAFTAQLLAEKSISPKFALSLKADLAILYKMKLKTFFKHYREEKEKTSENNQDQLHGS